MPAFVSRKWEKLRKKAIRDSLRHDQDKNIIQKRHCLSQLTWCLSFTIGPTCEWKDTRGKYSTISNNIPSLIPTLPITVVMRSKASVCGRSFAGTVGSNSAGGMDDSVVSVECCQVEVSASSWSLIKRRPTECDVPECDSEASTMNRPGQLGAVEPRQKKNTFNVIEQTAELGVSCQ